jgi:hypothetical protein
MRTKWMRLRGWLIVGALVTVAIFWHTRASSRSSSNSGDDTGVADGGALDKLLVDRVWIDHLPRNERDVFHVFLVMSEQPIGAFQTTSIWQGAYELYKYEAEGKRKLEITYPQNGDHDSVRATATRCDQGGMDYCLEMTGASRGVKRYYSREDWGAKTVRDAQHLVEALEHAAPR